MSLPSPATQLNLRHPVHCRVLASGPNCVAVAWDINQPLNRPYGAAADTPAAALNAAISAAGAFATFVSGRAESCAKIGISFDLLNFTIGSAGGGLVKVIFSGKGTVRGVHISPSLVTDGDVGVIEDLIVAAANDARKKVDARNAEEMNKLTDGLNLPAGLKLPF